MISRSKLYLACITSFLTGILLAGTYAFYVFRSTAEFAAHSEMLEDFTNSIAVISYFNNGTPEYALRLARDTLELSCEIYLGKEQPEFIRQHALEFVANAQQLGYCQ
jgi:hypothetical protein